MHSTLFIQSPPMLGNQYRDDAFLQSYLSRKLPAGVLHDIEPSLADMGALAGGELYQLQLRDRLNEPTLTQWDAWGNRIDRIEVSPLWQRASAIAASSGLIALAYERKHGRYSRIHQFAAVYLFHPSSDVYTCPLAMSDGAARTLSVSGNERLIARAVTRLTSRNPAEAWTSGQWMTEATGGSDVGAFLLAFELVELMGRQEAGELDDRQRALLRVITPIAKLLTAKQAVAVVSECIEAFGGAGYVEDTGLPALLRDTQVLPIWEGTTNVLALDTVLRGELSVGLPALQARIKQCIADAQDARLALAGKQAMDAVEHVMQWLSQNNDARRLQANARRLAMTLGRALELSLLIEHAATLNEAGHGDPVHVAAACRFAAAPIDLLTDINSEDSTRLLE